MSRAWQARQMDPSGPGGRGWTGERAPRHLEGEPQAQLGEVDQDRPIVPHLSLLPLIFQMFRLGRWCSQQPWGKDKRLGPLPVPTYTLILLLA